MRELILLLMLSSITYHLPFININIKRDILKNGITLLTLERRNLPLISIDIRVRAGSIYDPSELYGLANLTTSLLTEGTKRRSAKNISDEIEFVGGILDKSCSEDYSQVSLTILRKDIDIGFDILSDILINPIFDEKELNRKKGEIVAKIIKEREDPAIVAEKSFNKAIFLKHPYHNPVEGYEDSVKKIKREDIIRFYNMFYHPNNIIVSIVGDISHQEALSLMEKYFGNWRKKEINFPELKKPSKSKGLKIDKIDKGLKQANVILGHIGIERSNPDYYSIYLMNYILGGGGFASRLMSRVRDKMGLAYSIYSYFDAKAYPGAFKVVFQTKNESVNRAINAILENIEDMREGLISKEELEDAKRYLIGSFPIRLDTNSKVANYLTYIEFYNLGIDYFNEFPKKIEKVNREDILRVAKKYLDPDNITIVIVGDQKKIDLKLSN
jgi:zinc protease